MAATVQVYRSTDTGAPTLSGTLAELIALLDAVLLNGYNTQTATSVTSSSTTATFNKVAHGFTVGMNVLVAGANEANYNGTFTVVTTASADVFTYTMTGSAATPATGTVTAKRAPAGIAATPWTKAFTGTNLAAYRAGVGNRFYLRVDDTGTTDGRTVLYETMSDVNTGTGPTPTAAQVASGLFWPKSSAASAATRAWIIAVSDRLLFMHVNHDANATSLTGIMAAFGDIKSYKTGDAFGAVHIASIAAASTISNQMGATAAASNAGSVGHYVPRTYAQTGASIQFSKHSDAAKITSLTAAIGSAGLTYPNTPDGGLYMSPIYLTEATVVRGELPGFWCPLHAKPLSHLDTFNGTGALAGKSFLTLNMYNAGQCFIETSDTWST